MDPLPKRSPSPYGIWRIGFRGNVTNRVALSPSGGAGWRRLDGQNWNCSFVK